MRPAAASATRRAALRLNCRGQQYVLPLLLCLTAPAVVAAEADWESARSYAQRVENRVFRADVRPQWDEAGQSFWYQVATAPDAHEFVHVDAAAGKRRLAFDHERLATALAAAAEQEVAAQRLPLSGLKFPENGTVEFTAWGRRWRCSLEDYELEAIEAAADADESGVRLLRRVRPSRGGEVATGLEVLNRVAGPLAMFWVDPDGNLREYGLVAPGESFRQNTYAGHVWVVKQEDGATLAIFAATDQPGRLVVDGPQEPPQEEEEAPRRRGRRMRGGSRSPDGLLEAFVRDHQLWLRETDSGAEHQLSATASPDDFFDGQFYWSPDGRHLVAVQVARGEHRQIAIVESSPRDQLQPKLLQFEYEKPGDRLDRPRPRLYDAHERREIAVDDALFPNPWSLTDFQWRADGSELLMLYNERGHQNLRLLAIAAPAGTVRTIIDEHSDTFVHYSEKLLLHRVADSPEIIWMSERSGWNHLYLIDGQTGAVKNAITQGAWPVRDVIRIDDQARQVWFRATGVYPNQDPYHIHLCRVNFDGSGMTVLTVGDGSHRWDMSPTGEYFIDSWSRVDHPPVHELRRSDDGRLVCELERADWSRLLETGWRPPQRFVASGRDGATPIHGIVVRPTHFDPARKYPVLEDIYAGPQGAFVPKSFGLHHRMAELAELGFIVVQIDGMGTNYRGKAFHDVCWQNLGDSGFPDRIAWMKAAAAAHPELDLTRVGVFGGSAGGQSAVRALLAHGDFYHAAVADCGCHDNRMDKVWWNEQWMGWPLGPHYAEQSNVTQAHRLQGKLLLTVGELDRNVDPASTMQVVDALIRADKDFEMLVVPGAGHGVGESPYCKRRRQEFFVRHLLAPEAAP